jgi:hypothetical protein
MKFALAFCSLALTLIATWASAVHGAETSRYFGIQVIDDQTSRGVPLVELKTTSNQRFYTDSAGFIAIDDPALMNRNVFFAVSSHGYEFPPDGFGIRGVRCDVKAGQTKQIKIHRVNIARRLYRITGQGIYRDSVLLGRQVPIEQPLLNAQVTGQDSAQVIIYNDKIRWFWGDTNRLSYALGHFGMAGATADLPGQGGLDPAVGINLHYFTGPDGFSRPMIPKPSNLLRWMDGLLIVKDESGKDRLLATNLVLKSLAQPQFKQLIVYNDQADEFDELKPIPDDAPLYPAGHPRRVDNDGISYYYLGDGYLTARVRADWKSVTDFSTYEAFTCLVPGSRDRKSDSKLDRDADGHLVWGWKKNTAPPNLRQLVREVSQGRLTSAEALFVPFDVESNKPIQLDRGSVSYNDFRKKWILIACQSGGTTSMLGEIWYSESDHPEGPWLWARKIVTHDRYSFYNPVHHDFFDQQGGQIIYFEGTYTTTFSRTDDPTPLYDYNQIMYQLDLGDPRLELHR